LGRHVAVEPEWVAEPPACGHAAHSAELDGLQAPPACGSMLVVAADVVEGMDALVSADRDLACGGCDCRHAGEVVRRYRLLEEIQPGIGDRAYVLHRLLRAPALVGVGCNQRIAPEHPAHTAGGVRGAEGAGGPHPGLLSD